MSRTLILLVALLAGCETLENRFVYHPTRTDPRAATSLVPPLQDVALRTADGVKIHARWCPHPQARGALLYCHGNAGNLDHFGKLMRDFWESLDRSVLVFDYPGYGRSEGKPSEAGCYAAAGAAYDWLTRVEGIAPDRIVICGESLGGGVAVDLASRQPHQALVLIRTFTSIPDVAKQKVTLASSPGIIVNRFDSLKKIPSCRAPIFLAQADNDRLMPFGHGERLRDASTAPVRLHRLQGMDHNDPLPGSFFQSVREFLDEVNRQQ
jgi:pimeloyl-ACP methyl ester carboxylesterase